MDINPKDFERGYIDTGYIPEEGDNLGRIEEMSRKEKQMERDEKKWAKIFGTDEEDVGGFLERRNTDDRY